MRRVAALVITVWLACGCGDEGQDTGQLPGSVGAGGSVAGNGGGTVAAGVGGMPAGGTAVSGGSPSIVGGSGGAGAGGAPSSGGVASQAGSGGNAGSAAAEPDAGTGPASVGMPMPSSGCGKPWMAADAMMEQGRGGSPMLVARRSITVNGVERLYLLAVPPSYDPSVAHPLVFGFHGSGGDREQLRRYMNLEGPAAGNAVFIYPQGLPNDEGINEWDTAPTSADLVLVDMLLAQYEAELCIDVGRLFATGHSFGGCMTNAVGCFRGDVFRAIAPVAGCGPFARGGSACVGKVATLLIHGPLDTQTRYSGAITACTRYLRANACTEMPMCGCYWTEELGETGMACDQQAQHPYEPGVPVVTDMMDDAPPVLREYEDCESGYPVVFIEHHHREREAGAMNERWHNPPPWSAAVIWRFFSTLEAMVEPAP